MKRGAAGAGGLEDGSTTALRTSREHVGEVFSGRYRILRTLGEGGLGRVYEVEHLHVGRRFALKVLKEEHRGNASAVARFRQEARVGGMLDTPWTVAVVDYDVFRGAPYLVMEYLEGETLHALLAREGALPLERAARLLLDACHGVAAAHELGVFHRDLKPANLFVCRGPDRERGKVLDFGVAKLSASEDLTSAPPTTSTGGIVGTLAYMPPEQIRGEEPERASDVYSLGAILYECLAGFRAFDANTPHALMYQILEERPKPLSAVRPELPSAVVRAIEGALSPERAQRPQSALELESVLAPWVSDTEPSRSSVSQREPTPPGVRRPSWALLIGSAVAAAALGGVVAGPLSSEVPPTTLLNSVADEPASMERSIRGEQTEGHRPVEPQRGLAGDEHEPVAPAYVAPPAQSALASSPSSAARPSPPAPASNRERPERSPLGNGPSASQPAASVPPKSAPTSTARSADDLDFDVNPYRNER